MKQTIIRALNRIYLFIAALFLNVMAIAQEGGYNVNVDVNKGGEGWYANPWIWIVGAAVFILLLVAIVRGGGKTSD